MKYPKLIFVYNADSNPFALAMDFVHKSLSPDTYQCNLCRVTFGSVRMKKRWKEYVQGLPNETSFLHRDELKKKHPELKGKALPAVFAKENGEVKELVTASQINKQKDIPDLIKLVDSKLKRVA